MSMALVAVGGVVVLLGSGVAFLWTRRATERQLTCINMAVEAHAARAKQQKAIEQMQQQGYHRPALKTSAQI